VCWVRRVAHSLAQLAGGGDPGGRGAPAGTVTIEPQWAHVQATDRGSSFISTGHCHAWGGQFPSVGQTSRRRGASAVRLSLRCSGCGGVMQRAFGSIRFRVRIGGLSSAIKFA
jgi:hypothetical protein